MPLMSLNVKTNNGGSYTTVLPKVKVQCTLHSLITEEGQRQNGKQITILSGGDSERVRCLFDDGRICRIKPFNIMIQVVHVWKWKPFFYNELLMCDRQVT